jgi:fatty-acyl-CoA synthase
MPEPAGFDHGLGAWIPRRAAKSGASPAIIFDGTEISYAELDRLVAGFAALLRELGVAPGDRVAYLGNNHPRFLELLFATVSIGAVFVPLNTRLAAEELRYALNDSGSTLLVHDTELATLASSAAADTTVTRRIANDRELDALLGSASGARSMPMRAMTPDDAALILYTSGTTGRPKGAVLTHGNLTWSALNVLVDYDLVGTDVTLMISPLFHVASLGMGALPAILKGASIVLAKRFDPAQTLRDIERYRVTWMSGVPTTFQMLCEHPDWSTTDLSSLSKITCCGSSIPLHVLETYELRGLSFTGGYGMTEASPGVTSLQPAMSRAKAGSSGLPHFFTELRIGEHQPGSQIGEIELRGPHVMTRYWNRPTETADSFADGGWFRSGDLGLRDADGYLFISGRSKDMIISGGENVYPAEVEQQLGLLPGLRDVAVIGVPDARWGEVPLAVVTMLAGAAFDRDAAIDWLEGRLARYKIPKRFVVVDELPRTASGKVLKSELLAAHGVEAG